jgi:hypothetical protein
MMFVKLAAHKNLECERKLNIKGGCIPKQKKKKILSAAKIENLHLIISSSTFNME